MPRVREMTKKDINKLYQKQFLVKYLNSGQQTELDNEVSDAKNIITAFVANIRYTMEYLPDSELNTLYKNLTTENDQEFYNWVHNKYRDILKEKGCGAENRFLFSALVTRDFYKGNLNNISKGGDYLASLSKILEDKKNGIEYKAGESAIIPEIIVNRTRLLSIDVFTSLCQKVKTDSLNLVVFKNLFKEHLLDTIDFIAKLKDREVEIEKPNSRISDPQAQILNDSEKDFSQKRQKLDKSR